MILKPLEKLSAELAAGSALVRVAWPLAKRALLSQRMHDNQMVVHLNVMVYLSFIRDCLPVFKP